MGILESRIGERIQLVQKIMTLPLLGKHALTYQIRTKITRNSSSFKFLKAPNKQSWNKNYTTTTSSPPTANLVPIVVESTALGERSFDIFSRLLRERIICLHGEINDHTASLVTAQLLFLEAEQPEKPLFMYINSPGGAVTAGMAIYDTMQYIQPDVHTICMGQAASMGSLLLAAGTPGCRSALPNARIMLHQPSGGAQGMAADIEIQAKEILRIRHALNGLYVTHTGQSLEDIERVMDRDTFMSTEQAQEFGVIDKVLVKRPVLEKTDE